MNLAEFLADTRPLSIRGMPMYNDPVFFLDVILATDQSAIKFTGQAADVENRTEAFFLTAGTFDPSAWWRGADGEPAWQATDLTNAWKGTPIERIWLSRRVVKYYFDPQDRERGLTKQGPLDSAAALEFTAAVGDEDARLVLYATPEYPCSLEVAITSERCDEIIMKLREFSPGSPCMTVINSE